MNQLSFFRVLVVLNGAVPASILAWDAYQGQLGANAVNNSLHITGILSLTFLFLSLLMTPLHRITGWGGWIAFRRALGLYGFFYAVAHLIIYVGFDRALNLSSTLHEIWMRRFLQVGAVAILLMVPLAVTSTNGMIRRMGAKRWKLLHRATYLVAVLGVLHYYMLVKSDVRQPLAFAAVLTVLLGGRFGRHYFDLLQASRKSPPSRAATKALAAAKMDAATLPRPRPLWKGELRIAAIFQETPDVKTFRLASLDGSALPFNYLPGQFLNIQLMINGKRVNRSYTIASSPTRLNSCELSIKREPMGLASRFIHDQLKVGDIVNVSGPSGKFTFTGKVASAVVLIAGGVGITPVMSILRYLTDRAWMGEIYFLFVTKTEQDLIFYEEIRWLQRRHAQLHVCITLTRIESGSTWAADQGRPTAELLRRFVPNLNQLPVYLCGPNEMMDATKDLLSSIGVPASQVRTEAFAGRRTSASPTKADSATRGAYSTVSEPEAASISTSTTTGSSKIHFVRSNIHTEADLDTTILEAAEAASVDLPFECRSGICGQCKTRLVSGVVRMDSEDALSSTEKMDGLILACQARPMSNVAVEA